MLPAIGITDCDKWANYECWIKSIAADINVVCLKASGNNTGQVSKCCGIILTGGEDVHPEYYNKPEYVQQFHLTDLNRERDEFEFTLLKQVVANNIPLLGICRGLQVTNVFFGGTLIPDLPSAGKKLHSSGIETDAIHKAVPQRNTNLVSITGSAMGDINSHHHQAASAAGQGLQISAYSEDGVIEGLEMQNNRDHTAFFSLVQWHPERMNTENPFSGKLREAFVQSCKSYAG